MGEDQRDNRARNTKESMNIIADGFPQEKGSLHSHAPTLPDTKCNRLT